MKKSLYRTYLLNLQLFLARPARSLPRTASAAPHKA